MFPDRKLILPFGTKQRGWLMPVAAFIVVVMGLLAASLARLVSQASIAGAQEAVSVQTFFAAESAAQFAMNQLFYDIANPVTPSAADNSCTGINGSSISFGAPGMTGCQATITCAVSVDAGSSTSFYQIGSDARCRVGDLSAQRIIDVSAYLQ